MIKNTELRKGNLLQSDFGGGMLASHRQKLGLPHNFSEIVTVKIESIYDEGYNVELHDEAQPEHLGGGCSYSLCQYLHGIPLDEKILLNFGARNHQKGYIFQLFEDTFLILERTEFEDEGQGFDATLMQTDGHTILLHKMVQFVHELQNLFFILSGIELVMMEEPKFYANYLDYLQDKGIVFNEAGEAVVR